MIESEKDSILRIFQFMISHLTATGWNVLPSLILFLFLFACLCINSNFAEEESEMLGCQKVDEISQVIESERLWNVSFKRFNNGIFSIKDWKVDERNSKSDRKWENLTEIVSC